MGGARSTRPVLALIAALAAGCGGLTRFDVHEAIDRVGDRAIAIRYEIDYLKSGRAFRLARLTQSGRTFDHFDPDQSLPDWHFRYAYCHLYVDYPTGGDRGKALVQVWFDVRGDQISKTARPRNMVMAVLSFPLLIFQGASTTDYWTTFDHYEHWRLTITQTELTDLLEALLAEGLLDRTYRSPGNAWVRLWLGRWWSSRYWDPIPSLEGLVERVRTSGELLSLNRTADSPLDTLRTEGVPRSGIPTEGGSGPPGK